MARRILLKRPGEQPESISVNLQEESIRKLIGCTFESREYIGIAETADALILCAHQDTARALGFTEHIWLPTGHIAGPVIITRMVKGQYVNLSDDDISRWTSRLLEFEERKERHEHQIVGKLEETEQRRGYYVKKAISGDDDFTAIVRMHSEIEKQLRELVDSSLPNAKNLRREHFTVLQLLAMAASLNAIPESFLDVMAALTRIRNKLVHEPGYFPAPAQIAHVKDLAPEVGPFTDMDFIETMIFNDRADDGFGFSRESVDLRLLYYVVMLALDPEGGWFKEDSSPE